MYSLYVSYCFIDTALGLSVLDHKVLLGSDLKRWGAGARSVNQESQLSNFEQGTSELSNKCLRLIRYKRDLLLTPFSVKVRTLLFFLLFKPRKLGIPFGFSFQSPSINICSIKSTDHSASKITVYFFLFSVLPARSSCCHYLYLKIGFLVSIISPPQSIFYTAANFET